MVTMGKITAGVGTRTWVTIVKMPMPGFGITPRATNTVGRGVFRGNGIAGGNDGDTANARG